ncbi:Galactoside 2-alpha-L-fucosyltransferase 2 [Gracilariopsis chorda]|uniref:Galactoside 2-alpha-L-fucosyltransferase 2 n=1 Tax=Gracilariopsis chorda TaxID=448386 RepID=A0A2V3IUU3_9FLOR|nr:Galactoside 2-alpha-L-fucosyltransferase 2 [Gracilariopsis chorda]|eukprot:PXF45908.1 Galactoside 2-alpha-L-fucosyltransferase 2 [Gracilariopsis chorda]
MTLSKSNSLKRALPSLPPPEPKRTRKAVAADCAELATLLLSHARHTESSNAHLSPEALLRTAYPDRLPQLLSNINAFVGPAAFDQDHSFKQIQFDEPEDDYTDAVVPSIPTDVPLLPRRQSIVLPEQQFHVVPEPLSKPVKPATAYKAQTEIAISRIFQLGNTAAVADPTIPARIPYEGPSLLTMTAFGELGRFGNQMLQYMFLRAYAKRHGIAQIQLPPWVGASLFGLNDAPVQRALPPVVEYRDTLANSTFTTDLIDYVKRANPNFNVNELVPDSLDMGIVPDHQSVKNVDVWGWFQWHTSYYAPYKQLIQSVFTPVPELKAHMENVFERELRFRDGVRRTVVGLHLRLGDYKNIAASSFGYCAPTAWYLNWLQKIWPTLDNPVLFVASDDINAVLRDFAEYNPLTADAIGMGMPDDMKTLKAGFFPDWFGLTQCDVLAISNSTFSFSACMMNHQPNARFFRAHYRGVMEAFEPWNADPIMHRDMNKAGLSAALETLQLVYNTQGSRGVAKNLLYELPYYGLRSAIMKAVLWKQARSKLTAASA